MQYSSFPCSAIAGNPVDPVLCASLWSSLSWFEKVGRFYQKISLFLYEQEEERHVLLTKHLITVMTVGILSYLTRIPKKNNTYNSFDDRCIYLFTYYINQQANDVF